MPYLIRQLGSAHEWSGVSTRPNPPRIPVFYTLTKIHKPNPVGRPIVAGNDGPTERMSSFVDSLLQSIAKSQKSYLKDTTDFVNFIERRNLPEDVFLVSLDVASLIFLRPKIYM